MDPVYIYSFPNHFKGAGQPNFVGTSKDGKYKIAMWKKKDKKGRECWCSKIEEIEPESVRNIPKMQDSGYTPVEPEESANDAKKDDSEEEFLF